MRELILLLAMQGRLSEKCDDDDPVQDLLRAIDREKVGMKKSDESHLLPAQGGRWPIPKRWTWVRFGRIAQHNAGKTLDTGRNIGHARDYITTSNLYWGYFKIGELRQMLIRDDELERCTAKKGDLLICEGGEAGRAAVWPYDKEISFQNHVHRARFFGGINPYFVYRFFETINATGEIDNYRKGVGISNMSGKALASILLPLPPLAEQKRIVAKVDELMALCDLLEMQQQERDAQASALARASLARFAEAPTPANLNLLFHKSYSISPADLRKAILAMAVRGKLLPQNSKDESAEKLFARIHSIKENLIKERTIKRASVEPNPGKDTCAPLPTGWIWTRLGNTFDVRDGTHDTPKYTKEGYPLITSKNIYSGSLLFDGANLISENDHHQICERSKVDRNDILFAMIGSIGNPVVVDTDKEFSIKNVALFKYYEAADSEPGFLLLYLKLVAEEMRAKAAGGVQAFVSLGFLRNYVFPLPPLAEQRRIVAKVDQLMALVDQLETQLAASRATAKNLLEAVVAELTASSSRNHEDLVQAE